MLATIHGEKERTVKIAHVDPKVAKVLYTLRGKLPDGKTAANATKHRAIMFAAANTAVLLNRWS